MLQNSIEIYTFSLLIISLTLNPKPFSNKQTNIFHDFIGIIYSSTAKTKSMVWCFIRTTGELNKILNLFM